MPPRVRAFTLVELMIVVAIIGILAVVAVVGYRRLVSSAKATEPRHIIAATRLAQESYKAETGRYASVNTNADVYTTFCPLAVPTNVKTGWNPACGSGTSTWRDLNVASDGPVMFGYATTANVAGTAPPAITIASSVTFPWPATTTTDWYVVYAQGDTDANGVSCRLLGHSFSNQIVAEQEGE